MKRATACRILAGILTLGTALAIGNNANAGGKNDKRPILPTGAKLEKIFDKGLVLTEGVCVAPDGMVYFSDITFTGVSKEKGRPLEAGHIW